jgi:hypothetical protein
VTEALRAINNSLKATLQESTNTHNFHVFHESGHFEIEEVGASKLPLYFDGATFSIQASTEIDDQLLSLEIDHYNQLVGSVGVSDMVTCLSQNPTSKKAYQSFWENTDMSGVSGEVPCMVGIHAYIENENIYFVTQMRSNNAFRLLEIDLYIGMALQIYIANQLHKGVGAYCHQVASLIVYGKDRDAILGNV